MMRRIVAVLLFLMLVNEGDPTTLYAKPLPRGFSPTGFAPFEWVQSFVFDPLPFKLRPFDLVVAALLIAATFVKSDKAPLVRPMRNALFLAIGTVVLWFAYGVATGGDARAASWQIYLMLSAILFAFTVAKVFTKPAHYEFLMKVVIAAGLYRATMCWYFNFVYVAPVQWDTHPEYITAHDDSVIWVICFIAVLIHALTRRGTWTFVRAGLVELCLLGAIQWNTRRLAWVSLVMGLITAFFLLPKGKLKRRVTRSVMIAAPVLALYVAVGWGRPEKIFAPLESLASVSTQEDRSTKARNAENLGLIETVKRSSSIAGTGWGHGYVSLTDKYSIAQMELWPYIPHNSVLGLLAYTGILGFVGYWLAFPTAAFLNARLAKLAASQLERNIGFVCTTSMIVCGNQLYGDMGIFSLRNMYMLAVTYAVALRLPVVACVWQQGGAGVRPAAAPQAPPVPRVVQVDPRNVS